MDEIKTVVAEPESESMMMAIKKRCPYDAQVLVKIDDPDFGLCWSCPKCGYLEPVE